MKMNNVMKKMFLAAACLSALALGSLAHSAETAHQGEPAKPSATEKLVANQPTATAAASTDPKADKPMTINFSDFVKDGAGCGVPNLDTSGK